MLLHYFKIAFRNYQNNKIQSLITLFSLAVSFACVSLAAYWNHYEQTYDSFLTNYDRIYWIGEKKYGYELRRNISTFGFHSYLMSNYSEVDKACGIQTVWKDNVAVEINDHTIQAGCEKITPEAIDIFEIKWLEGNRNMDSWGKDEVAISEHIAREVCGKESPIGEKMVVREKDGITVKGEYRITAVFKARPEHSNFNFQVLSKLEEDPSIHRQTNCCTYILLKPNADANLFSQKIAANPYIDKVGIKRTYNAMIPLSDMHFTVLQKKRNIHLNDVKLFAGASILLSVCALLNYLTLFISRLRNRGRDMALRAICGSSSWQTGALLMVEYLLLLLVSLALSTLFIEFFYNGFVKLSQLEIDRSTIYVGCSYLLLFILGLATVLSLVPILYFKNKTLRVQIESVPVQLGRNRFRIAGVCMQLFISLLFIFCSTVMIKQIHYLIYADINIERKNIAWVIAPFEVDVTMNTLKQIPTVTEMVEVATTIFPSGITIVRQIQCGEDFGDLVIDAKEVQINQGIAQFYGLKMKEGTESFDLNHQECLINETFAKQLGIPNPIGKVLSGFEKMVIRGIVHDFQFQNPTQPVPALIFRPHFRSQLNNRIAFKYTGDFNECQAVIKKALENVDAVHPEPKVQRALDRFPIMFADGETVYNGYLTSEFNLLKLLNTVTVISLLIALFGVYSLILQECERQRKNIAIRKVFGAQVKDILMMFFKQYMLQVVIAAAFAFPIGYVLMKRWLEGYSRQTSIGIEVFLGIFIGMAFLVMLCIGWHVWRAANENPATAVKKE